MSIMEVTYNTFRADMRIVINKVGVPTSEPEVLNFHPQRDFVETYDTLFNHMQRTNHLSGTAVVPPDITDALSGFMSKYRLRDPPVPPEE